MVCDGHAPKANLKLWPFIKLSGRLAMPRIHWFTFLTNLQVHSFLLWEPLCAYAEALLVSSDDVNYLKCHSTFGSVSSVSFIGFYFFFFLMYSWLFSTVLVCPCGSSGDTRIMRSLRNRKHGCYAFGGHVLMSVHNCTETTVVICKLLV